MLCYSCHICSKSSAPSAFYFRQSLSSKDRNNQGNYLLSSQLNSHHLQTKLLLLRKTCRSYLYPPSSLQKEERCIIPILYLSTPVSFLYPKMLSTRMPVFYVPDWFFLFQKYSAYYMHTVSWIRNIWPETLRPLQNLKCFSVLGRIFLVWSFQFKALILFQSCFIFLQAFVKMGFYKILVVFRRNPTVICIRNSLARLQLSLFDIWIYKTRALHSENYNLL